MKNNYFAFILLLILSACSSFRTNTNEIEYGANGNEIAKNDVKRKDGKCYAKAMIPDKFSEKETRYPIYTGDGMPEGVEMQNLTLSPATTKWVKKAGDRNCLSADPNDCMVWCLVEIPAQNEVVMMVIDTNKVKDFVMRSFSQRSLSSEGGVTSWVEVLCEDQETPILFHNIKASLKARGYSTGDKDENDTTLKVALTQFQKDKGLPVGRFNIPTMKALGVQY